MPLVTRREFARPAAHRPPADADYWLRIHRRAMACRFEVTLGGEDAGDLEI